MTIKNKITLPFLVISLIGCTTAQLKAERYQETFDNFTNPTNIKICYSRTDGATRGIEYRCFGKGCELPRCPDEVTN